MKSSPLKEYEIHLSYLCPYCDWPNWVNYNQFKLNKKVVIYCDSCSKKYVPDDPAAVLPEFSAASSNKELLEEVRVDLAGFIDEKDLKKILQRINFDKYKNAEEIISKVFEMWSPKC